jgi:hypothetical protein
MHGCQAFRCSVAMHNFSGTTLRQDASVLFTRGRKAMHNGQHRLLHRTDIAHNTALREHFQRSEECNGSEKRGCT